MSLQEKEIWTQRNTSVTHTQRKDYVRTQQESGHLIDKDKDFRRNQTSGHLYLLDYEKINSFCLSRTIYDALFWQPQQTNTKMQCRIMAAQAGKRSGHEET